MSAPAFTGPDLCRLTACEAVDSLKSKEISPDELITAAMARIAQTGPHVNATVTLCEDRARKAARDLPANSLLAGLPLGIKDLNPVEGVRTTWGNAALADHIAPASDAITRKIEGSGGLVINKTNTPEMGAGANTFNAVFGKTRNPWDTRMNAGGSSGGAAASLAVGEAWLCQGSDLGGSLRTPASFCGIVGLRPSPGLVPSGPGDQAFDTMPVNGPMARNVADCALFLDAMVGFDPASPLSIAPDPRGYLTTTLSEPKALRIGFSPTLNQSCPVAPDLVHVLTTAVGRLNGTQVDVVSAEPSITDLAPCFRTLRAFGFWTQARLTPERVKAAYKPALKQNIADGAALTTEDLAHATVQRTRLYEAMQAFFQDHDILACPVSGLGPLPVEIEYPPEIAGHVSKDYLDWLCFAFLATLCGLPALSLPVGHLASGLPVGIQLIGKPRGEAALLQAARFIEDSLALPTGPIDPVVRH